MRLGLGKEAVFVWTVVIVLVGCVPSGDCVYGLAAPRYRTATISYKCQFAYEIAGELALHRRYRFLGYVFDHLHMIYHNALHSSWAMSNVKLMDMRTPVGNIDITTENLFAYVCQSCIIQDYIKSINSMFSVTLLAIVVFGILCYPKVLHY